VAALSFVFDKSNDATIYQKSISGFRKCAMISAHYGMSNDFDNLIISLCKFTTLLNSTEVSTYFIYSLQILIFKCFLDSRESDNLFWKQH